MRENRGAQDGVHDAEVLEDAPGVRAELEAGADLLDLGGALQDGDLHPALGEGDGGAHAADSPAHDDDLVSCGHDCFSRSSR